MSLLARLALAGFLLSLGVAVASPLVKPPSLELVCSGGSLKLVTDDGAGSSPSRTLLDCPVCGALDAPPPLRVAEAIRPHAASRLPTGPQVIPCVRQAAAPPPARGPPGPVLPG